MKNMKRSNVLGIVAEYNPFHNGHLYQLNKCKELSDAECVVAVMSGNFTQRGEIALLDKWTRAKMAILSGVDLVVELPFYYACNSAEYFAKGAVEILDSLGAVTHIGFGSEDGDINKLSGIAKKLNGEDEKFQDELKIHLSKGLSYPRARTLALGENSDLITLPNNILAIEYLRQLFLRESMIFPVTVKRYKTGYHQKEKVDGIQSGTSIRTFLKKDCDITQIAIPTASFNEINGQKDKILFYDNQKLFDMIRTTILTKDSYQLERIFSIGEGLENKLLKEIRNQKDLKSLIEAVKSKRYTRTRIQRMLIHILVNFEKNHNKPNYIRVLGFNDRGGSLLKYIKKEKLNSMPIVTNINKHKDLDFSLDIRATDIYNIISGSDIYSNSDFTNKPIIIR